MSEASGSYRGQRFELVDEDGRLRAVLGRLGEQEGEGLYGLSLHDKTGERAWFLVGPTGIDFGMARGPLDGGDTLVSLRLDEGPHVAAPGVVLDFRP